MYGVFIPQMIGSLDLSAKGSISLSALFYPMLLLIFRFPLCRDPSHSGSRFWNWEFDSGTLGVEFWHLRVEFIPESILAPGSRF